MCRNLRQLVYGLTFCWLMAHTGFSQSIHLHLDRSAYAPGDTIWFAAYALADSLSETLYTELVNPERKAVAQRLFRLNRGRASGFFPLPDTLVRGPYRLRAYTRRSTWTDTYSSELVWLTARSSRLLEPPPADSLWEIRAFPEGGYLVNNLPASVVIRVTDPDEQGVRTEGVLTNERQEEVARFETDKLGQARVFFTPQPGRTYQVKTRAGTATLPPARSSGVSLLIDEVTQPDGLRVRLFRSRPVADSLRRLTLLALHQDSVWFATTDSSESAYLTKRIPRQRLPVGIVRFVVLGSRNQLLAERLAWGQMPDLPKLELISHQPAENGKLRLVVQLTDSSGNALQGRFSVSVTDSAQTAYTEADRATTPIRTHLPGLPARLRHPAQVWPTTPANRQHLDRYLTTLTDWPRAAADSLSEKGLMVEGMAQDDKKRPLANQKLLLLDGRTRNMLTLQTNERGYFGFSYPPGLDTVSLLVQQLDAKNRPQPTKVSWLPRLVPTWQTEGVFPALAYVPGSAQPTDTTKWARDGQELQTVQVRARRQLIREKYIADYSLTTTDQYLDRAGVATGQHLVHYLINQPGFTQLARSSNLSRLSASIQFNPLDTEPIDVYARNVPCAILIDNKFYGDSQEATTQLRSLSAYAIERVEVVRVLTKNVIIMSGLPPRPGDPLISIITRMGPYGSGVKAYSSQTLQYRQPGYSRVPAFPRANRKGQSTLFWHPDLATDSTGNVSISLGQPQTPTTLQVTVEGISQDGQPVSATWKLPVKIESTSK
jgi:hypothetical protein